MTSHQQRERENRLMPFRFKGIIYLDDIHQSHSTCQLNAIDKLIALMVARLGLICYATFHGWWLLIAQPQLDFWPTHRRWSHPDMCCYPTKMCLYAYHLLIDLLEICVIIMHHLNYIVLQSYPPQSMSNPEYTMHHNLV